MTFKEYKNTEDYKKAIMLDVYSIETGYEFDENFPEEKLDEMEVVKIEWFGEWLHVTLKG